MKTTRQFLLVSAVVAVLGVSTNAQTLQRVVVQKTPDTGTNAAAQKSRCSGTVTDAAGNPLAGVTVEYWRYEGNPFLANRLELKNQITTETNGAFEFQVSRAAGFLLARKPELAPSWKQLGQPFNPLREPDEKLKLVLAPPAALAGVVVDEAGKPVANAEVSVTMASSEISPEGAGRTFNYITGKPAHDYFAGRTDAVGHFRIENFPTNATATLAVQFPGKVLGQSQPDFAGADSLPWHAGQDDIKLVVEPAGSVEGKILVTESNQPPPVARLTLQPDGPGFFASGEREPAQSGADGAFRISDVAAGSYRVHAVFGTNAVSDWVADAVPVSVEVGQTVRGVQVTAARGGLLEVAVLGKNDRKPLPQIMVNAYKENFQSAASSGSNGVAVLRLLPGDYQVAAFRESMPGGQASASVEAGKTNRVEIEIAAPQKITGIVRLPDGQPATGLPVRIVGGNGSAAADVKTDAGGKFELEWNQRQFGQNDATVCILVRDSEHNLAVAQDLDEDTTNLDLKLAPAITLTGRAEAGGKPLTNATAQLVFWTGRSGMWLQGLARTNTPGQYEIPALPPGRKYGVIVSAPGYGQKQNHNLEISADPGRQELDTVELKLANLKLAGQVLDADDKPVARCNVNLSGEDQPNANARTDRDGRFSFAHVCEGTIRLSANSQRAYGSISAEGGDTNVILHLGENMSSSPGTTMHKLKGVVTDADGQPVGGVRVAVLPNSNGSRWVKTGTNGEYSLNWSLQSWQLQNGGAHLVFLDKARNLAGTEELPEETTNLNVKLKPAIAFSGQVKNADGSTLPGAQMALWIKMGNSYDYLDEPASTPVNAEGRFEIKCLPSDAQYLVSASAKGYGKHQQNLSPEYETNRVELEPFVLKHADSVIAGQILKDDDKPASGVNVQLSGEDQPDGNMTSDSKGRFHFQVCEGQIRLFAYSQSGNGNAQATVEAGDTNIVMNLSSQPGNVRQPPRRAALKGSPLPDLATVHLASDTAPAGQPVLLCLFDAGQRPSRHVISQLEQQAAALRQQNIFVLGVQAAVTTDDLFNQWKSASPVSFPVGRVTEKSEKSKWASTVSALPWLILTDASHHVVAEGFALDELDAQVKKLAK
jgi:protocatechuate 3,4-dioxygenase beta subunit